MRAGSTTRQRGATPSSPRSPAPDTGLGQDEFLPCGRLLGGRDCLWTGFALRGPFRVKEGIPPVVEPFHPSQDLIGSAAPRSPGLSVFIGCIAAGRVKAERPRKLVWSYWSGESFRPHGHHGYGRHGRCFRRSAALRCRTPSRPSWRSTCRRSTRRGAAPGQATVRRGAGSPGRRRTNKAVHSTGQAECGARGAARRPVCAKPPRAAGTGVVRRFRGGKAGQRPGEGSYSTLSVSPGMTGFAYASRGLPCSRRPGTADFTHHGLRGLTWTQVSRRR